MPNLNLLLTKANYKLFMVHKALVGADTWDQYVEKACGHFPMKIKVYGEKFEFSDPPPKHKDNRNVTVRMSDDTHTRVGETRKHLGYTWREFLMYPSQNDKVPEIITEWESTTSTSMVTKVHMGPYPFKDGEDAE